jgi:putative phosphoesterase
MKYMFISDLHGNLENLEKYIEIFEQKNVDKLVILGDTSGGYYDDKDYYIAEILNNMKGKVEVMRGNCDTIDFEEMLEFEVFDDDILPIVTKNGEYKFISITHGHLYNYNHLPPNCGDIFIQGHTHVPMLLESGGRILANPGSPTRPRGSNLKCYILVDEEAIYLISIDGEIIKQMNFSPLGTRH